jgi:hypothetical protein
MLTFKLKGRPPSCLVGEDKTYHHLFYWIYKHKWVNIIYYLKKMLRMKDCKSEDININNTNNTKTIYMNIIKFCINKLKLGNDSQRELEDNDNSNGNDKLKEYETKWDTKKYSEDYHFILKTIFGFINIKNESIKNRDRKHNLYICPNKEEIDSIQSLLTTLDNVPRNKQGEILVYKILSYKRQYPLYDEIGSFKLVRFSISHEEYKKEHYYNWEYYASHMPIWEKRIKQCGGKICDDTKKVIFENDTNYEKFYELYGYEFDEQSLEIQDMSLLNIDKKTPIEWIERIQCIQIKTSIEMEMEIKHLNVDSDIIESFKQLNELIV